MLTNHDINYLDKICNKWLFSNNCDNSKHNSKNNSENNKNFVNFEKIYSFLKNIDFTSPINFFTSRLSNIPYKFKESEIVSGSICFYGGVFTSLLNTGKVEQIEGLFTFAVCYMLIDHFLDDINNTEEEKSKAMKEIYEFLTRKEIEKKEQEEESPLISSIKERYFALISEIPEVKKVLISLFQSEIQGHKISNNLHLTREDYKKIAEEKGGKTSSAIATIIGIPHDKNSCHYKCGSLIQYVDDLLDIQDDEDLNIYTLARYDLDRNNLDKYIYEVIIEIANLDSTYNFFKIILLYGVILAIHDRPNSVSEKLRNLLSKYDPFDSTTSKASLNIWFHKKLYEYIDNNI